MNTLEELKAVVENKNYKMYLSDRMDGTTAIGLSSGKGVFHWFEDTFGTGAYYFGHSYSQNNGSSKRGLKHSVRIKMRLGLI